MYQQQKSGIVELVEQQLRRKKLSNILLFDPIYISFQKEVRFYK